MRASGSVQRNVARQGVSITFPLTIDGTVRIKVPDVVSAPGRAALTALETGLERVRASTISREESRILFDVNWFRFVPNWNLLVGIRSGSIHVALSDQVLKLSFSLRSFDFLAFALVAGLSSLAFFTRGHATDMAMVWTSIFGIGYLTRWIRFRWFVQRCVVDAFDEWVAMAKIA